MDTQDFLDAVTADSERFAQLTATALDQPIEFLGDWLVRDLVGHLGAVYSVVIAQIVAACDEMTPPGDVATAPADDAELVAWFAERRATLLATFAQADDDAPAFSHAGVQSPGWWKRRLAHETAVHVWDADAAINGAEAAAPIDSDLATDGVDEYLEIGLLYSSSRPNRAYPDQSLHLHRSDGNGEWMIASDGQGGVAVTHEHGKGDAAVRGPASELVLWAWGRPTSDIQIFGDESVAAAWQALAP